MAAFTAKDVQALRQATGAGMMDAKKALEASDGDMEKARQWLRVQGLAGAAKRSDRKASQGAVAIGVAGSGAAIVELRCETDFVAKSEELVSLVGELADLVAAKGEQAMKEREGAIEELKTTLKENISPGQVVRFEVAEGAVLGTYLHTQAGRGVNAVMVELKGAGDQVAHDVAVHIAFARPAYVSRSEVPEADVAAERAVIEEMSVKEGKPEAALAKVVEGRMQGWYKERCLLDQPYARDEKQSVADLLGSAEVLRFAQVVVGS
jgi:elongation factor Ts